MNIPQLLKQSKVIAVIGFQSNNSLPAYYVPHYLFEQGYKVIGVNPKYKGEVFFGNKVVGDISEISEPIDIVEIFRAPQHLMTHLPEILDLQPMPRAVWLQSGILHKEFAEKLREAGIEVIESRCMMIDHRFLAMLP